MGALLIVASQIVQIWPIITAVTLNIALTLAIWVFVYGTQTNKEAKAFYLFDSHGNFTTGNDIYDGMLNGFICLASLAVLSFVMLAFAMYNFRRLLQFWLFVSCLLINFFISASLFRDILNVFGFLDEHLALLVLLSVVYGAVGCMVFFTNRLPSICHQFYVVCNCSMVSLFYLRTFPHQTTWFVLAGIILWDLFAVLAPIGPLRLIADKAADYSEIVLRMLMFHVETGGEGHITRPHAIAAINDNTEGDNSVADDESMAYECRQKSNDDEDGVKEEVLNLHVGLLDIDNFNSPSLHDLHSDIATEKFANLDVTTARNLAAGSDSNSEINSFVSEFMLEDKAFEGRTAHDALQDGNVTRLGMGDFVFYSLLVGKAAVSGSFLATFAAAFGVLVGLIITLTAFPDYDDSVPALPVSIFLGIFLHFTMLLAVEPMLVNLAGLLWSAWSDASTTITDL